MSYVLRLDQLHEVAHVIPERHLYLHYWLCSFTEYLYSFLDPSNRPSLGNFGGVYVSKVLEEVLPLLRVRIVSPGNTECPDCNKRPYEIELVTDYFQEVSKDAQKTVIISLTGKTESDLWSKVPMDKANTDYELHVMESIFIPSKTYLHSGYKFYIIQSLLAKFLRQQENMKFYRTSSNLLVCLNEAYELRIREHSRLLMLLGSELNKLKSSADELGIVLK